MCWLPLDAILPTILFSRILKFGIAINNDAKRLQTGFGVYLSGWVDLQHIAVRCGLR